MEWMKARRKLLVGIAMVVTLMVAYSAKTAAPVKTFLVLTAVAGILILLQIATLRLLQRPK